MDDIPGRLRFPTADDMGAAVRDDHQIVAFSARSKDRILFLKLGTRTSGAATLSFDPIVAQWLYTALGDFLRIGTHSVESEAKWHDGEFHDAQGEVEEE